MLPCSLPCLFQLLQLTFAAHTSTAQEVWFRSTTRRMSSLDAAPLMLMLDALVSTGIHKGGLPLPQRFQDTLLQHVQVGRWRGERAGGAMVGNMCRCGDGGQRVVDRCRPCGQLQCCRLGHGAQLAGIVGGDVGHAAACADGAIVGKASVMGCRPCDAR